MSSFFDRELRNFYVPEERWRSAKSPQTRSAKHSGLKKEDAASLARKEKIVAYCLVGIMVGFCAWAAVAASAWAL